MVAERRISHQLVNYWQQIKGERILPLENAIEPDDLADMWEDCFLIHMREGADGGVAVSYSFLGAHLQPIFVEEHRGGSYLLSLPPARFETAYYEMCMTKLPIVEHVEEYPMQGGLIKYRQCLLPIGTEKGEITCVFGGMRFKYI